MKLLISLKKFKFPIWTFFNKFISISPRAIFIKIAEIIGNGRYLKYQSNNNQDISNVKIAWSSLAVKNARSKIIDVITPEAANTLPNLKWGDAG